MPALIAWAFTCIWLIGVWRYHRKRYKVLVHVFLLSKPQNLTNQKQIIYNYIKISNK